VLSAATLMVVAVSAIVTVFRFTAASWPPLLAALVLAGLIYAALVALAGAILEKLTATYLIVFLAITDLGIVQKPDVRKRYARTLGPATPVILGASAGIPQPGLVRALM
jgi:hypothetical protein